MGHFADTGSTASTKSAVYLNTAEIIPFDQLSHEIKPRNSFMKYVCPVCGKEFPDKTVFRTHYMIHTGEKPFACPHCPYKTNQKSHLKTHIVGKHRQLGVNHSAF